MSPTETRDRSLALAFKNGEREAYARIYELHHARVHNLCKRMLGNAHDAEEATQETFLRVYQGLLRFNGRYLLRAWILRIATNVCLDGLRVRGRRPMSVELDERLELTLDEDADPEERVLKASEGSQVRKVLKRLPPLHRAALVLRDLEGLSYDEISVVLAMNPSQVKALIHRARQGFKRSWPTQLAEVLIPARLLHRMRGLDRVPTEASQVSQIASNAAPYAAQCSTFIQQCGQFASEKAASIVVAVAVGASAVGGGMAMGSGSAAQSDDSVAISTRNVREVAQVEGKKILKPRLVAVAPVPSPDPAATGEPQPASSPTAPPEAEPAPAGQPPVAPQPTPTASGSPSPPPEPTGFTGYFGALVAPGTQCGCLNTGWTESNAVVRVSSAGLQTFTQYLEGNATVGGTATYGLTLVHRGDPGQHRGNFYLGTVEGRYSYEFGGALASAATTTWGGLTYSYTGTYRLEGRPSYAERVPEAGNYRATVIFSRTQQRIVAVSFDLTS